MKIAVLGAGGWGTALACLWHHFEKDALLWTPFEEEARALRSGGNKLLPGVPIPASLVIETNLERALAGADIVIIATPSKFMRETARKAGKMMAGTVVVSAAKGLEAGAERPSRMTEVIRAEVPPAVGVAAMSGPSHAEEVARLLPTTMVVAGDAAEKIRDACSTPVFRIYTSPDVIGVELGGTLKNPIAIAAGISRGLGSGDNGMGALVTRGIAEITRFGAAVGADPRTFAGLSGIGDLVTTCISRHSRNGRVGEEIAKGRKLDEVLKELGMVAEGVETARIVDQWGKKLGVETPITSAVVRILFENADPRREVEGLMKRSLKDEF